ncbi:RRP12-like protein isoform X2 [Brassica rapa]|uniref:RRP12-like protein isoform X2 n=1 Tax=Brassica campestris TaxID=3711 RepID=UPI00142DE1BE|nr:RRP12-like protein isoform X2 [Brassica rapa]
MESLCLGIETSLCLTPSEPDLPVSGDFGEFMLSRLSQSKRPDLNHLCAVIDELSKALAEGNHSRTPVAYFAATCSSLDSLLSSDAEPPMDVVQPHVVILSLVFPKVSAGVLKRNGLALRLVLSVLRLRSVTPECLISALKCLVHLLTMGNEVSEAHSVLLNLATHSDGKVRKLANSCLRDVLEKTRGTKACQSVSGTIAESFQKHLDLAHNSEARSAEGAQQVLYLLSTLKECVALMSKKHVATVIEGFKMLMVTRDAFVARPVIDSLNALCLNPTSEVPVEALVEVLYHAAVLFSAPETSADAMTSTARLFKVGMVRAFSLNRDVCVVKLPGVFNGLKDIIASEHEEAIFAATDALKSLICSCIDESLIREGVNGIQNSKLDVKKSSPTVIEKLCATVESLLDYKYHAVWDMAFQVVSTMFNKLGEESSYFMRKTLEDLSDMQDLPDEGFPYRKQLHECVGSALGAMGPETFLNIVRLNLEASDLSEVNVWLFPILKQYTVGGRLSFFTETIFRMVETMSHKAQQLKLQGLTAASRSVDSLVYSLWALLPSFCNYPVDTAESFEDLGRILCGALQTQAETRGVICTSLNILIQQNKDVVEGKEVPVNDAASPALVRAITRYDSHHAAANLEVMRSCAPKLLDVLSKIFHESGKDDGGSLQSAIGNLASIAEKKTVSKLLFKTLRELLMATKTAIAEDESFVSGMDVDNAADKNSSSNLRARLFDLLVSLLPGLDGQEVDTVFSSLKPAMQDPKGQIQKKAYKVLSVILKSSDGFVSKNLEELLELMHNICHVSAKRHKLDCLYFLLAYASKTDDLKARKDIVSSFLPEVILALKEVNKKTRSRAYDVLVQIGHAYADEENGGDNEKLHGYFNMVVGCLAGEKPQMISAAVKGVARLTYEFPDLIASAYNLLPSTFLLLQRKNKEITKANLGLLKVLVAKSPVEGLHANLKSIVEGLLKWPEGTKNLFKAKVRLLLEMLIKKCGTEAVKSVMPEEHMKLLTNIRKVKERKERKYAAGSEMSRSQHSKETSSKASRWNDTKIFSDFADEDEDSDGDYMDGESNGRSKTLKSKASKKHPRQSHLEVDESDDEPLDLMDRYKTRSALRSSELGRKRKADSDEEAEFDAEGRLIIYEGERAKRKEISDADSDAKSRFSVNTSRKNQKRLKISESGYAYTGKEYASKKASGDLKRKDKLEPYAYWPLDRKMMSRRPDQRAVAVRGMSSVVKLTKRLEGKSAAEALATTKFQKFRSGQKKPAGKKKSK